MAKPIAAMVKLQVPAGQATPAPPVGTALGPHGVNIMEFVKQFNAKTAQAQGMITPVEVTIYKDRTFTFITKMPDLNANDLDAAMKMVAGTARSMGLEVVD